MRSDLIEQHVGDILQRYHPAEKGRTMVVAISGGADSVCLLKVLTNLKKEVGINLHAAHLDHGIRGGDSQNDASYVAALCNRLKIPLTIKHENVYAYKKKHRCSLEEAARNVRYAFLADVLQTVNGSCVAVGHTRDDQIETVLLHIIRGSGITGLRGLQVVSSLVINGMKQPLTIIRPLLTVTRKQTEAYCRRHRLQPQHDITNEDTSFLRNRIRMELLPQLRSYNEQVEQSILRLSSLAADDIDFIDHETEKLWDTTAQMKDSAIFFNADLIRSAPLVMQRQLMRKGVAHLLGNLRDFDAGHIDSMIQIAAKPTGKSISLPHGLTFSSNYEMLVLASSPGPPCPLPVLKKPASIRVPGRSQFNGWHITARIINNPRKNSLFDKVKQSHPTALFDRDALGDNLILRSRMPGDRFRPLGMKKSKKLQDFMVDKHIPRTCRDHIPLLCTQDHIAWIVGWQIDDRVKVTENSSAAVRITFKKVQDDH